MATIRAADGGYLLNSEQFNYTKDAQGRPVLNVVGGGGGTVTEDDIENALGYKPISADDVPVKKVNGATGEVKSTFYVTVTQGADDSVTADKTAAEVYATYEAGYAVYAIVKFKSVEVPYTLPLAVAANVSGSVVLGFGALGSTDSTASPLYLCVLYNGFAWVVWKGILAKLKDIPAQLANPYSLNIKIGDTTTSYDGSVEETVEIPVDAILPPFTVADNDKVLGIVNGALAWVTKA